MSNKLDDLKLSYEYYKTSDSAEYCVLNDCVYRLIEMVEELYNKTDDLQQEINGIKVVLNHLDH
jgi:hypothetical protein